MMRVFLFAVAAFAALSFTGGVRAEDKKDDDEVGKALSKIVQLGPGVHAIKKDDKGRIISCIMVGQSRISTVLGATKGLETARERARLAASGEFVKWLKEKVSIHVKTDDQTTLFLEGAEGNDKDALKESGKAVESTSKTMDSITEGLVRGLQVLHVEVSDKDKTYSILLGWDAKTAAATNGVEKINETGKPAGGAKKPDKKIDDKNATSDNAKNFLPGH
jgi:hypothetical protein